MTVSITNSSEYLRVLNDIKSRIRSARVKATHEVNRELIDLYWNIGKIIVEKQAQLGWGKAVVETLSKDIRKEFPGISGYSPDNLWRMRQFYLEYSDIQIMEQLVPELKQLLQKGGKTTKNKISFLEQPVPEIPDFVGSQKKRKWALKVLKQLVAGIPWGHKLVGMASGYLFDIPNYLLKGVREGADYNRNQVITLSELQLYLETLVPKDAKQTPQRITLDSSRGGQFVFYWDGEE